jgi:NOL1/NOP2/fmu family ribosome biogenesis protein
MKNENLRVAAGIKVENILRSRNDRNFLTILYAIDSIEESENFIKLANTERMSKELTIEGSIAVEYFEVFY